MSGTSPPFPPLYDEFAARCRRLRARLGLRSYEELARYGPLPPDVLIRMAAGFPEPIETYAVQLGYTYGRAIAARQADPALRETALAAAEALPPPVAERFRRGLRLACQGGAGDGSRA